MLTVVSQCVKLMNSSILRTAVDRRVKTARVLSRWGSVASRSCESHFGGRRGASPLRFSRRVRPEAKTGWVDDAQVNVGHVVGAVGDLQVWGGWLR